MTSTDLRRLEQFIAGCFVIFMLVACSKEHLPFSSGALSGEVTKAPSSWNELGSVDIIQLETMGASGEPYSVNLWMIGEQGWVYVYAGDNHTEWAQNLETNGKARLLIDGKLYDLQASRVTDQAEFDRFALAWDQKYGSSRPKDSSIGDVWLFRLFAK